MLTDNTTMLNAVVPHCSKLEGNKRCPDSFRAQELNYISSDFSEQKTPLLTAKGLVRADD